MFKLKVGDRYASKTGLTSDADKARTWTRESHVHSHITHTRDRRWNPLMATYTKERLTLVECRVVEVSESEIE